MKKFFLFVFMLALLIVAFIAGRAFEKREATSAIHESYKNSYDTQIVVERGYYDDVSTDRAVQARCFPFDTENPIIEYAYIK